MIEFLRKITAHYFKPSQNEVQKALEDIELFYSLVLEYYNLISNLDKAHDFWYFKSVFKQDYTRYLHPFNFLTKESLTRLHEGIMSILIFQCYVEVNGTSSLSDQNMVKTIRLLKKLKFKHVKTRLLRNQVYKSIRLTKWKNTGNAKTELIEAVGYIVQHIIRQNTKHTIATENTPGHRQTD